MTEEQIKVDALLITTASRLMNAAAAASVLRVSIMRNWHADAIRASAELAEHVEVADVALQEVARLIGIQNAARTALQKLQNLHGGTIQ